MRNDFYHPLINSLEEQPRESEKIQIRTFKIKKKLRIFPLGSPPKFPPATCLAV